jgi:hypothetical protein
MSLDTPNWPTIETEVEATALLVRARGFLEHGWCRHTSARNFFGMSVSAYSRWATAWCANGALRAARLTASDLVRRRAGIRLTAAIGGCLSDFNDAQETVEPVLAAFDRAIAEGHSPSAGDR